jgi:pilus assembly protein Flp/PilA
MYSIILALSNFKDKLSRREEGVTALEYGLIAALIAVAIITGLNTLATALNGNFTNIAGHL